MAKDQNNLTFYSPYSIDEIRKILLDDNILKSYFSIDTKFKGEISNSKISLQSIEHSPTIIQGSVNKLSDNPDFKTELIINVETIETISLALKVILIMVYSVLFSIYIILIYNNPKSLSTYLWIIPFSIIPYCFFKVYLNLEINDSSKKIVMDSFKKKIKAINV